MGATKLRTFRDVTLPLIWKGVLVGALYSFILAMQEASAALLLVVPGHEMMTVGILISTSAAPSAKRRPWA